MSRQAIFEASVSYFLGPIGAFLEDESVTEIMVNGPDQIYIERRGRLELTSARFSSDDALMSAIHNVAQWVGREINEDRPVLDARLPDGSRVHAVIPSASRRIYLTVRKFSRETLTLDDLVGFGSLSPIAKEFLELCVRMKKNILISGGTGTGKTSLLNALSTAIPDEERIVVIEDTSELRLIQRHCLYLEARPPNAFDRGGLTVRQLFVASLRMRPDRIVVGEVRSGEALDLVQSMLSGHAGSLSTIHANTPRDALIRLETLSLMSDVQIPVYVARAQAGSAIHLIVQLARFVEDGSRKITQIAEVRGLDRDNNYQIGELFSHKIVGRTSRGELTAELAPTGLAPSFGDELAQHGLASEVKLTKSLFS
jgi:pilus assembly protein CpaF